MCTLLGLSVSGYYRYRSRPAGETASPLLPAIQKIVEEFSGYGYRRVTRELLRRGHQVNHKRVLALMQAAGVLNLLSHPRGALQMAPGAYDGIRGQKPS
jgi:putative transposase